MLMQNFRTAEELKISPELFDGLHQVLRMFERRELVWASVTNMKPGGFNMAHEFAKDDCGTAGCILGWARFLSKGKVSIGNSISNNPELCRLYSGWGDMNLHALTVEQAEHALRAYLVTGQADWQ